MFWESPCDLDWAEQLVAEGERQILEQLDRLQRLCEPEECAAAERGVLAALEAVHTANVRLLETQQSEAFAPLQSDFGG